MNAIETRYYHIKGTPEASDCKWGDGKGDNYVEAEVYYTKGGYSYFTYKSVPRGYYMSVTTMKRYQLDGVDMVERTLFSDNGRKRLIQEVARQSKTAEANAHKVFADHVDEFIKTVFPDLELELEEVK